MESLFWLGLLAHLISPHREELSQELHPDFNLDEQGLSQELNPPLALEPDIIDFFYQETGREYTHVISGWPEDGIVGLINNNDLGSYNCIDHVLRDEAGSYAYLCDEEYEGFFREREAVVSLGGYDVFDDFFNNADTDHGIQLIGFENIYERERFEEFYNDLTPNMRRSIRAIDPRIVGDFIGFYIGVAIHELGLILFKGGNDLSWPDTAFHEATHLLNKELEREGNSIFDELIEIHQEVTWYNDCSFGSSYEFLSFERNPYKFVDEESCELVAHIYSNPESVRACMYSNPIRREVELLFMWNYISRDQYDFLQAQD